MSYKWKKLEKIVSKHRRKYKKQQKLVELARNQWENFDSRFRETFEKLKEFHEEDEFYSQLFIQDDNFGLGNTQVRNRHHVAIRFGLKPLDISEIEFDIATGNPKSFKQELEDGGALFFSQTVNGGVSVYLLPSKNDLLKFKDNLLLLNNYSDPCSILEKQFFKHINQFFWFSLITSHIYNFSFRDLLKVNFYKLRSRTLKINWTFIVSLLTLIVTLLSLVYLIYAE